MQLWYITCVEMEEQMVIDDGKIVVILINTFDFAGIRTSGPTRGRRTCTTCASS